MSRRPPIIALDGNHRVGKGTQLDILYEKLMGEGYAPVILRGDGTRPGTGSMEGDPVSEWWQNFKQFEAGHANPYEAWRKGACRLLAEAAAWFSKPSVGGRVFLFDRAGISRAQMTLKEGLPVGVATMYGNPDYVRKLWPDVTIYMAASTEVLLARLDPSDPKYKFRENNIITSNPYFNDAYEAYGSLGVGVATEIDANAPAGKVAEEIDSIILDIVRKKVI
ncbi:MAG TPA: hypothetical protein PKE10_03430 [Candidatus Saccharibacteria bacterium]|nr:hypothetical protein [Candidatus Saccharibacteria bacterium]